MIKRLWCKLFGHAYREIDVAAAADCVRCGEHREAITWNRMPAPTRPAPPMPFVKPPKH